MNARPNTTRADEAATEHPATKVHRLSRELCAAMRANPDSHALTMIYADPAISHSIMYCEDREYARMTQALFSYRDAFMAWWKLKEKPRSNACREARANLDAEHHAFNMTILEASEVRS